MFRNLLGGPGGRIIHFDDRGVRAMPNPINAVQRVNQALTGFVLRKGGKSTRDVGTKIFPVVPIEKMLFSIPRGSVEENVLMDTRRTWRGNIRHSTWTVEEILKQAERYTYAYVVDVDQDKNSMDPWDVAAYSTMKARDTVLLSLDAKAAELVNTTGGATVYGSVLVGGDWTGAGAMLSDVNAAASILTINTGGLGKENFTLFVFSEARQAAESDAEFLDRRSRGTAGATAPTLSDVAGYLGIKEVIPITGTVQLTPEASPTYLFPPHAVLAYVGDPSLVARQFGDQGWGFTFRVDNEGAGGAALDPYYEPEKTSWSYPWQTRQVIAITDPTCAVAITSPS